MTQPHRRLRQILAPPTPQTMRSRTSWRRVLAVMTAVAGIFGLGGILGVLVGGGAAIGIVVTGRTPSRPPLASSEDVPAVVELIAGCLTAGLPMPAALEAASVAGDDVIRDACFAAAAALRRGAPAAEAWQSWSSDPSLEPVARATRRTTQTGASVADDLRRVAARLRARRQSQVQQRVQQASIWVVVPLGLCFLPAFVLVAVVPIVIGLFQHVR